jgi:hypothetical protein
VCYCYRFANISPFTARVKALIQAFHQSESLFIACIMNNVNRTRFYRLMHKLVQTVEPLVVEVKQEVVGFRDQITVDHKMRLVDRMIAFRQVSHIAG